MHLLPGGRVDQRIVDGERVCQAIAGLDDHIRPNVVDRPSRAAAEEDKVARLEWSARWELGPARPLSASRLFIPPTSEEPVPDLRPLHLTDDRGVPLGNDSTLLRVQVRTPTG